MKTITVFFVKKISNCFWEIADTWSFKSEKIAKLYTKGIGKEYRKEYEACGVSSGATILHIGCGAYPLTEIMLTDCCTGQIVGIDKNLQTVQQAQEVIQKRKLEQHITIKHGDGLNYPADGFDAIIVSSCSLPKVKILEHLFKIAKPQSTIIVREVDIAAGDILHCINAHPDIVLVKQVRHNPFPFFEPIGWTTFCLKKK